MATDRQAGKQVGWYGVYYIEVLSPFSSQKTSRSNLQNPLGGKRFFMRFFVCPSPRFTTTKYFLKNKHQKPNQTNITIVQVS